MNQFEPWSEDDNETLRRMCAEGATSKEIGLRVGRTGSAVIGRAFRLGIKLAHSTPATRAAGAARAGAIWAEPDRHIERKSGDWDGRVIETWDERKARKALTRALNDDDLPEAERWAREFAFETPRSMRAALGVLAGRLGDPRLLRHVADRLEAQSNAAEIGPVHSSANLSPAASATRHSTGSSGAYR